AASLTSSMIPSGSCPGTIGSHWLLRWPLYCSTSLPQIPQASTRSSPPSSGPITGRGNSLISICRGPVCTAARIMSAKVVLRDDVQRNQRRRPGRVTRRRVRPVLGPGTAVDGEVAPGDQAGVVGRQPGDAVSDVGGSGGLAHRDVPAHVVRAGLAPPGRPVRLRPPRSQLGADLRPPPGP